MILNIIFNFLFGAVVGSFLNALIYRIPRKISIYKRRSFCPKCNHQLAWYDLIPILSYILLKGKCRYCGNKISPRYLIVEIITALYFSFSFLIFGYSIYYIESIFFFSVLLVISLIDLEFMEIPDSLIVVGIVVEILFMILKKNYIPSLLGMFIPPLIFALIILISKGGMGGGDFKYSFFLGLTLGFPKVIPWFILSFILGFFPAIYLLISKKKGRKSPIPFGPFMSLSAIIIYIWGDSIIRFYTSLML